MCVEGYEIEMNFEKAQLSYRLQYDGTYSTCPYQQTFSAMCIPYIMFCLI